MSVLPKSQYSVLLLTTQPSQSAKNKKKERNRRPKPSATDHWCLCGNHCSSVLVISSNQMVSEEPDPFLQFIFLPLGETIKGRHGQAEDSVELLWWEVTLGKQDRQKSLRTEKSKTAGWGNEKCDKPTKICFTILAFQQSMRRLM